MPNANEIVQDPKRAEAIDRLQGSFQKDYDLSKPADRQTLVEGLAECGKAVALTGKTASLSITYGVDGITAVSVNSTPTETAAKKDE